MPTCTPGLSKSLLMLVKYRIFSSLDLVAKMQGCDTRVLSVYVLKLNLYSLVSHLQKGISCILPPIFSMARTVFSELPQETLDLDHLKAVLISIWALGINKALSCFSLIVISGTSCHLCFATWHKQENKELDIIGKSETGVGGLIQVKKENLAKPSYF